MFLKRHAEVDAAIGSPDGAGGREVSGAEQLPVWSGLPGTAHAGKYRSPWRAMSIRLSQGAKRLPC